MDGDLKSIKGSEDIEVLNQTIVMPGVTKIIEGLVVECIFAI